MPEDCDVLGEWLSQRRGGRVRLAVAERGTKRRLADTVRQNARETFQRHKLRVWSVYDFDFGRRGELSLSGLWRVNSGQVYSLRLNQSLSSVQKSLLAAYPDLPGSETVFFGERGSQDFKGYGVIDLSVNYNVPVLVSARPWVKMDVFNALCR